MLSEQGAAVDIPAGRWKAPVLPPLALALAGFVTVRLFVLGALLLATEEQGKSGYRLLTKWDAQWYAGIADNGNGFVRIHEDGRLLADYVFFPLLPLLERAVAGMTGLASVDAGLVVSAVASVVAAAGIFAVADHLFGPRTGVIAAVLWAALPVGIVQSMAYSEGLFTAVSAWALHAILKDRWLIAGVLACAAGLTRPVGAAVIAALLVAVVLHSVRVGDSKRGSRRPRLSPRPLAAAAIAPLGLLGYITWVGWQVGGATGYFNVASEWGNGFDGGVAFTRWIGQLLTGPAPVTGVLVLASLALLALLVFLCVKQRQPLPLIVFVSALVVLALTTSGYFGSKPRYLLPAFPLLFPLAQWLARRPIGVAVAVLATATAIAAIYGSVWLLGPGPP